MSVTYDIVGEFHYTHFVQFLVALFSQSESICELDAESATIRTPHHYIEFDWSNDRGRVYQREDPQMDLCEFYFDGFTGRLKRDLERIVYMVESIEVDEQTAIFRIFDAP
uniref:Uncharacterized protein n=1 Tax=Ochrobactrum phage ORM_20 TaxID=2985243 RepID=A0A9N6WZU8_9VIRU|nr:hypothetical protein ORM20_00096 [Ochrobactrum phage ORM_20]